MTKTLFSGRTLGLMTHTRTSRFSLLSFTTQDCKMKSSCSLFIQRRSEQIDHSNTRTQREVVLRPTGKEQTLNYILFEWSFELKLNSCAWGCVFMKTWSDAHFSDILMSWYCFSVCDSQRFSVLLLFPLTFWIYVISQNKSGHRDYIHCWGRGSTTKYSYFLYNTPLESEHQHLSTSTKRRDKTAPETQRGWEVIKGYIAQ